MSEFEERNELISEADEIEAEKNEAPIEPVEPVEPEDDEIDEDTADTTTEFKNNFQTKIAALSEKTWTVIQIVVGIVMGLAVVVFLGGGSESSSSMSFTLYAAAIALVVPNLLEKACDRSVWTGKMAMLISLAVGIVGQLVLHLTGVIG